MIQKEKYQTGLKKLKYCVQMASDTYQGVKWKVQIYVDNGLNQITKVKFLDMHALGFMPLVGVKLIFLFNIQRQHWCKIFPLDTNAQNLS